MVSFVRSPVSLYLACDSTGFSDRQWVHSEICGSVNIKAGSVWQNNHANEFHTTFRSAVLLSFLFVLKTHYAAAADDASAECPAAIPGVGNVAGNIGGAIGDLPDVMGTVGDVVDTASGTANNLAGAAGNIAGGLPIAGPLLQQRLGAVVLRSKRFRSIVTAGVNHNVEVLGLLGAVLGIAHQLPQSAASASMQAST
ncbi:hypothetical protein ANCCAN_12448 [Ancylostoma caninum]|uniref:Uncharacterized protein n=1 Tax=Ancylostoma caninum TaxID=29170 RepID=A0A368GEV9_ANCCA|nr:hypothetical protein ANCCAN_12448 [Ancylostoma caninum]